MPDENGGQPLADNVEQTPAEARPGTETRLDGESVFDDKTETPELEEKYRGKSPVELARMHKEAEAKLGKQSTELGEIRKKLDEYGQILQRTAWEKEYATQQQRAAQPTPPPQPRPDPDYPAPTRFDWDKPEQSAARIARETTRQDMAQLYQGIRAETAMEQAQMMAPIAIQEAMRSSPELFKGVEDKVGMAMDMAIRNRIFRPQDVANPQTWKTVAWQIQGLQNQYRMPQAVNPVSPTMTETPSGIRSGAEDTDTVELGTELSENIRKGWKEDPKKVAKALAEDRRAARQGRG